MATSMQPETQNGIQDVTKRTTAANTTAPSTGAIPSTAPLVNAQQQTSGIVPTNLAPLPQTQSSSSPGTPQSAAPSITPMNQAPPSPATAPSTPKWAYQDGRYSVEGGSSGFSPEMAGRVFLDDGTEATAGNLPPGYLLTPEAVQRMKEGFAVNLTKGGGAQYIATDAAQNALQNGVGGRGTANGGVEMYGPDNRPTLNAVGNDAQSAALQRAGQWTGSTPEQMADFNKQAGLQSLLSQGASPNQLQASGYDPSLSTYVAPPSNPLDQIQFPTTGPIAGAPNAQPSGAPASSPPASSPSLPTLGPTTGSAGMGNVAQTPTTPANALTNQTLSRAPGADRFQLAQQAVDAWDKGTRPQFEADERQLTRQAAGHGQLNTGQLRTQYGNLGAARDAQRQMLQSNYLTDALRGTIDDAFKDVGVAQQQQGFQFGQQNTAFSQALQQAMAEDSLTGNAFERALQSAQFGYSGNPSDTYLGLANTFGRAAGDASSAAGNYAQSQASGTSGSGSNLYWDKINAYLKSLGIDITGGGSGGTDLTPTEVQWPNTTR